MYLLRKEQGSVRHTRCPQNPYTFLKSATHFLNNSNVKDDTYHPSAQTVDKTFNAAISFRKNGPEPPGKHGMPVREIGGKANEGFTGLKGGKIQLISKICSFRWVSYLVLAQRFLLFSMIRWIDKKGLTQQDIEV